MDDTRVTATFWSDIITGVILVISGCRSLRPNRPVSIWIACFAGVWLNVAPLIFWAPESLIYLNDTFSWRPVIALTILIPGMPNMVIFMKMGSEIPPGWTYNRRHGRSDGR